MTRADKIKAYVKERYGVEINENALTQTEFRFQGCDGFECTPECMHDEEAPDCDKCKYNEFWEQEDRDNLYTNENIYKELINTQELIFKIMPTIYDIHTYIKCIDEELNRKNHRNICDRCGVKLTEENNKCGLDICDKCNEELEREVSDVLSNS